MADSFFPEIEDVTVSERIVEVDLKKFGVDMVAQLRARSNFSDLVPPREDKSEKFAQFYSAKHGCTVAPFTVRMADRLVTVWNGPNKANGKPPTVSDFIKLSITNKEAFAELVNYSSEDTSEGDVEALVEKAVENFTLTESAGGE